jgi:pentatricopeptide repeat protein
MIVEMYGKCGATEDARCVFESIRVKTVYSWNIMISAYVQNECFESALVLFREMLASEGIEPDNFTLSSALSACIDRSMLDEGRLIHSKIVSSGLESDVVIGTALLNMYSKCGSLDDALRMFDRIRKHDIVAWNAMIAACVYCNNDRCALEVFDKLLHRKDVSPNHSTYASILRACASIESNADFSWIHVEIVLSGVEMDVVIGTALVNMYSRCGDLEMAETVFYRMDQRDLVTWNTLLSAYVYYRHSFDILQFLRQMKLRGIDPDDYTFSTAVDGCSNLQEGQNVHVYILEAGFEQYSAVVKALITMYSKCGSLEDAEISFCRMSYCHTVISWNAMISAYQEHGHSNKAIALYFQMLDAEAATPNDITFISVLSACSAVASLDDGKMVHKALSDSGFESDAVIARAVVHMYGKCGDLDNCSKVFDKILDKNVVCWNIIINAYAQHGMGEEALLLFTRMQKDGVQPDAITFISVLHACSHAGLVKEAKFYYASMTRDHGISPSVEHYVSMIDLFGRFGHLDEAEALLKDATVSHDVVAWKAFLGACKKHGADKRRAKYAAEQVMKLEPKLSAPYVLLSDM